MRTIFEIIITEDDINHAAGVMLISLLIACIYWALDLLTNWRKK